MDSTVVRPLRSDAEDRDANESLDTNYDARFKNRNMAFIPKIPCTKKTIYNLELLINLHRGVYEQALHRFI